MLRRVIIVTTVIAASCSFASCVASASARCSLYASPVGSDSGTGSVARPFATAQKLVDSLRPGAKGCLLGGTYSQPEVSFGHGGVAGAPVTLASYPGQEAVLSGGFVYVPAGSDYVTIENLSINATAATQVGVQVMASHVSLIGDEITNGHAHTSCVILGSTSGWGQAVDTVIEDSVIHDCGNVVDGNQDHAIYFDNSLDGMVTNSIIWGSAASAIHLYPNAQGNKISHDVIDGNGYGVIFAGSNAYASSGNTVAYNLITDSRVGYGAQSWWGGGTGTRNVFRDNCLFGNAAGEIERPTTGFSSTGNVIAQPLYVNATAHDYMRRAGSHCRPLAGYETAARLAGTIRTATARKSSRAS